MCKFKILTFALLCSSPLAFCCGADEAKGLIRQINLARMNPKGYTTTVAEWYKQHNETWNKQTEATATLNKLQSATTLAPDLGLNKLALQLANELAKNANLENANTSTAEMARIAVVINEARRKLQADHRIEFDGADIGVAFYNKSARYTVAANTPVNHPAPAGTRTSPTDVGPWLFKWNAGPEVNAWFRSGAQRIGAGYCKSGDRVAYVWILDANLPATKPESYWTAINENYWHTISCEYGNQKKVLTARTADDINLELQWGAIQDSALWRLQRSETGYRISNKKGKSLDFAGDKLKLTTTGKVWTLENISNIGTEWFIPVNSGKTIELSASGKDIVVKPKSARPNNRSQVSWRILPAPLLVNASKSNGIAGTPKDLRMPPEMRTASQTTWEEKYPSFSDTYSQYLTTSQHVHIVGTKNVKPWTMLRVQLVVDNMLRSLKDYDQVKHKFRHNLVVVIGKSDKDINGFPLLKQERAEWKTNWNELRGGANKNWSIVAEDMICHQGITGRIDPRTRTPDNIFRAYDQVVHELGHTIERVVDKETETDRWFRGRKPSSSTWTANKWAREEFAWGTERWFNAKDAGAGGTRADIKSGTKLPGGAGYNSAHYKHFASVFNPNRYWFVPPAYRRSNASDLVGSTFTLSTKSKGPSLVLTDLGNKQFGLKKKSSDQKNKQRWKVVADKKRPTYFLLATDEQTDNVLESGDMSWQKSSDQSGKLWNMKSIANGYVQLTTEFQNNQGKVLDIVGANSEAKWTAPRNLNSQWWKITPVTD